MSLWRPTYLVELLADPADTDGVVHTVKIMHGDQLRAELEAGKQGVDTSHPLHLTSLWCWSAMVRTHATELPWQEWRRLVAAMERVPQPAVEATVEAGGADESLDPTQPDTRQRSG